MKTFHNFNLVSADKLTQEITPINSFHAAMHLMTHTHTNIGFWVQTRCKFISTILLFSLMLGGSGYIFAQPAEDPCGCMSFTTIGVTGEKRNISAFDPIPDCTYFKGKIVIDEETTWEDKRIRMETGAEIEVISKLYLIECNLGTCDDLWKGIKVVGDEDNVVISVSESIISGAEIATRLTDQARYSFYHSHFINNYIGISTGSPFEAEPSPMVVYPDDGIIEGCHFYTDGQLPDPYPGQYYYPSWPSNPAIPYNQGYAAFYIASSTGLELGRLNATGTARNKVHHMRNGMVVIASTTQVFGTDFSNFAGSVPKFAAYNDKLNYNQRAISLEGSACHAERDSFINVMIGVHSTRSSQDIVRNYMNIAVQTPVAATRGIKLQQPVGAYVAENIIYNGYMGIDVFGSWNGGLDITYNDLFRSLSVDNNVGINLQRVFGISVSNTVDENEIEITGAHRAVGISMNEVSELNLYHNIVDFLETISLTAGEENAGISGLAVFNSLIAENYITGNANYRTNDDNAGIILTNSMANDLHCNNTDDLFFGVHILGSNMTTDLKSNEIYDANIGLQLFSPVTLGTQKHHLNQWLGSYSAFGAFIEGPDPEGTAAASQFVADAADASPGVLIPSVIGPSIIQTSWFIDISTNESNGVQCNDYPPPAPLADSLVKIVRNPYSFTDYEDEMNWMRKADILHLLHLYPAYLSNTVLDSFFDAESTTALGELIWAEYQLSKGHGIDPGMPAKDGLAFNFLSQVRVLDSLILLNPINVVAIKALRVLKIDTLSWHFADWIGFLEDQINDTEVAVDDAMDVIDNVTPSKDLETHLQSLLLLQCLHFKGDTLTSGELDDVYSYARQCPWLGARSMAEAQMLYAAIADSIFTHRPGECNESDPFNVMERSTQERISDDFRVYPNPANTILKMELPWWAESLTIHSLEGMLWRVIDVSCESIVAIEIRDIPSGLYTLRIKGGNQIEARQFTIVQ